MRIPIFLALAFALSSSIAHAESPNKAEATPDFCQTDKEGQFDKGGRVFCGPVAVSNSLMYLAQSGSPLLLDGKEPQKQTQIELIRTLGSPDYMATEGADGTSTQRLMNGASKYVTEHGCKFSKLEYRGWRNAKKEFKPTDERPSLQWVAEAVDNPRGTACINVGWYTHDSATDTYTRHGGHWITVTGASDSADEPLLALHDPASRSGAGKVTHQAHVDSLSSGTLSDPSADRSTKAEGLFVIRDGLIPKTVVKGEKTHPIIDGIVVMILE